MFRPNVGLLAYLLVATSLLQMVVLIIQLNGVNRWHIKKQKHSLLIGYVYACNCPRDQLYTVFL